jgi:hypothetical protein
VKEEALIYRLARPPVTAEEEAEEPGAGVDRAAMVELKLQAIEEKLREQGSA